MRDRDVILADLFQRTTKGIKLGLDRMRRAAAALGNPQDSYATIHVAGTNGKGSVCAYLDSTLRRAGKRTGLYMSPHIVRFEERFLVGGAPVSEDEWLDVYRSCRGLIDKLDLTFFEAATLIAFELFRRKNVEWAVIETGLGGRLDATNILSPKACAITTLGMDHMEYLGADIVSIAKEKLGIVKHGVPLVMARPKEPGVAAAAQEACASGGAALTFASAGELSDVKMHAGGWRFSCGGGSFDIPLAGVYQPLNALCAIKTLRACGFADMAVVAEGLRQTFLPGRLQRVTIAGKTVIFDVGHNPQAAACFAESLAGLYPHARACLVVGIMKDKDVHEMVRAYAQIAASIIAAQPATERACEAPALAAHVPADFAGTTEIIARVGDAVRKALDSRYNLVCVVGSFYTVGEAMQALGIEPYGSGGEPQARGLAHGHESADIINETTSRDSRIPAERR